MKRGSLIKLCFLAVVKKLLFHVCMCVSGCICMCVRVYDKFG